MTLLDIVRLLRRRWSTLLVAVLLGLAAAAVFSYLQPVRYTATSSGYLVSGSASTTINTDPEKAAGVANSYIPLANTKSVQNRIRADLKNHPSGARGGAISARIVAGSNIMAVTASSDTPAKAQAIADAGVRAMGAEIQRLESLNPGAAKKGSSTSVDDIPTTARVRIALVPFEPASLPSNPSSPDWKKNLALGALGGLALGAVWIFVRKLLDVRARTSDEVEELAGASVIGVIPQSSELSKTRKKGRGGGDMGIAGEAMRHLRTNLRYVKVDAPPKSIVVSSANPSEGKSTLAGNLARVLAEAGRKTVIIDADLRRPMQATAFNRDGKVGLTQVLAGEVRLHSALQRTDTPGLLLLPAGRIPPNPSELVGSNHMAEIIRELARDYTVIIDAPPVLPVTDAGLLAAASDGAILVVRVGKTYKDQVSLTAKMVRRGGGEVLGVVMNGATKKELGEVMYGHTGYGYASQYGDYASKPRKRGRRAAEADSGDVRSAELSEEHDPIRPSRALPDA